MKNKDHIIVFFILCFSSFLIRAQDKDTIQTENFIFSPSIAGGQIEVTSLLIVTELGALVDFDLFKKKSRIDYSFGARFSYENYSYLEFKHSTIEGPYQDYCFYAMHSGRSENIHFNLLVGLTYHPETSKYSPATALFRAGFEIRFNLGTKIVGLIFKGATSFDANTTYFGLGIAVGYYE